MQFRLFYPFAHVAGVLGIVVREKDGDGIARGHGKAEGGRTNAEVRLRLINLHSDFLSKGGGSSRRSAAGDCSVLRRERTRSPCFFSSRRKISKTVCTSQPSSFASSSRIRQTSSIGFSCFISLV